MSKIKSVYAVGINDADYVVQIKETIGYVDGKQKQKTVWVCPFYKTWNGMIGRGYSEKIKLKQPAYKDVTVCEEWHLFSTFRAWMIEQEWEDKHIDKDLILPGNKVYSPETCVFVSRSVNNFLIERGNDRGEYKIGVCWDKQCGKFQALCCNPFTKKQENLGRFVEEDQAHKAWLDKKLEHAYALAAIQGDERVSKAIIDKYENYGSNS